MLTEILYLIAAFIITAILGRIIIPVLKKLKVGQSERLDGPRTHLKKKGTPTMGGIMMIITILILSIIASIINQEFAKVILPVLLVSIGFGLVGFIDDFKKVVLKNTDGLSPKLKLLGQLVVSVIFILFLLNYTDLGTIIKIPFTDITIELPNFVYIPLMILVMLGTTNAVNLTDGVDGLAGSVSAIIIAAFSIIAFRSGIYGISMFGAICSGACCGFLIYNFHKAKVIMGDTGSLLLGGVISSIAIYLQNPLLLIIIAIIPVVETLSVIAQVFSCTFFGKRIIKMAPLHHHFELSGWRENRVVGVFSFITLIFSIIGILAV